MCETRGGLCEAGGKTEEGSETELREDGIKYGDDTVKWKMEVRRNDGNESLSSYQNAGKRY